MIDPVGTDRPTGLWWVRWVRWVRWVLCGLWVTCAIVGSERPSKGGDSGAGGKDAVASSKALLALGNVISKLSDATRKVSK